MATTSTTAVKPDHKAIADQFMFNAVEIGQLQAVGLSLKEETEKKVENPDKIVKYLQKVGENLKTHLALYKTLETIDRAPVEEILDQLADNLNKADESLIIFTEPLYNRVFTIEMQAVTELYKVAEAKLLAYRKDPNTKNEAEEAARAVVDRFSIIHNIKKNCNFPGGRDDNETLRIADERIEAMFEELFSKNTQVIKGATQIDNPFEDDVEVDPELTTKDTKVVQDSESEEEEEPLQSSNTTTSTKESDILDTQESKTKETTPEVRSVTPFKNSELTDHEKATHDLAKEISQLEQVAKGQNKPVDQDAIKGLVESRLKLDDLNALRGLIYQFAKDANPNDPALKEWDFGNKYLAANLTRLYEALAELSKQVKKTD